MVLSSFSSTFAPVSAEAKRANVPLLYMGSVCPKEVSPPADPNQFCTTAYILGYDSRAALDFVKAKAKEPVRIGFSAMAVPLSRAELEYAEGHSKTLGMTPVGRENIPPPTPDYTPFATKLKEANPNWMYSYAPWVTQVRTLEAMRRLGWQGDYIAWGHIEAEADLVRVKDPKFYVIGANALFQDGLPVHREITDVAKKGNTQYPPEQMTEGWVGGLVVEAVLKSAGWPASADKIRAAMEGIKVDTKGPARHAARVDQDQSRPDPAVLPRLPLGSGQECRRACDGLEDLRGQIAATCLLAPRSRSMRAGRRCLLSPRENRWCSSPSTSSCWHRSTP